MNNLILAIIGTLWIPVFCFGIALIQAFKEVEEDEKIERGQRN